MVVSPDHRRKGLANQLMAALMEAAGDMVVSLNSTTMGKPLYDSLGFTMMDGYIGFTLPSGTSVWAPSLPWCGVEDVSIRMAPTTKDVEKIAALDTATFGGDRTDLLVWSP